MRTRRAIRRVGRRGSVFIFTMWLTTGLAIAALFYGHRTKLHYDRAGNYTARVAADEAATGMQRYLLAMLAAETDLTTLPDLTAYANESTPIGGAHVWLIGREDTEDDATDATEPTWGLTDEAAKLNLNTATLEMLEALPGMTSEFAAAIIDWRDEDSELTDGGAEEPSYLDFEPAYHCKNAPFESVEELRLVAGADPDLLWGRDRNRNGILESWEEALVFGERGRFEEVPDIGLVAYLTAVTVEPNTRADGSARTSLTGPAPQILQALSTAIGAGRAQQIAQGAGLGTRTFTSVLEFCVRGKATAEEAATLLDLLTVADGETLPGRVNINSAPVAVLACIPGIGEDLAASVVAYRIQNPSALTSPMWLATALGDDAAILAGPWITATSYQTAADIVAVSERGRAFRRLRVVIDRRGTAPTVIERRDLTHLGWPLGPDLLETRHTLDWEGSP